MPTIQAAAIPTTPRALRAARRSEAIEVMCMRLARLILVSTIIAAPIVAQDGLIEASFEAATIKRNVSGAENWALNPRPTGQFTVTNARGSDLVQPAFLLQDDQLAGLPNWTRNERFDIVAKLDAALAARAQPPGFQPTW